MKAEELKKNFITWLKRGELWPVFLKEYGTDWEAKDWYSDGWWFEDDVIQYRVCDLFSDYADGYNWNFISDGWDECLIIVLKSHGFVVEHNSGDDEDGLLRLEYKPLEQAA